MSFSTYTNPDDIEVHAGGNGFTFHSTGQDVQLRMHLLAQPEWEVTEDDYWNISFNYVIQWPTDAEYCERAGCNSQQGGSFGDMYVFAGWDEPCCNHINWGGGPGNVEIGGFNHATYDGHINSEYTWGLNPVGGVEGLTNEPFYVSFYNIELTSTWDIPEKEVPEPGTLGLLSLGLLGFYRARRLVK